MCWRLDRLGRNLRHLILLLDDLSALGVAFVSLAEGIDATTPAGRLQLHILGAIAEFERARIGERVKAGLARARAQGKTLGRPRTGVTVPRGLTVRRAAALWGVSKSTAARWAQRGPRARPGTNPTTRGLTFALVPLARWGARGDWDKQMFFGPSPPVLLESRPWSERDRCN